MERGREKPQRKETAFLHFPIALHPLSTDDSGQVLTLPPSRPGVCFPMRLRRIQPPAPFAGPPEHPGTACPATDGFRTSTKSKVQDSEAENLKSNSLRTLLLGENLDARLGPAVEQSVNRAVAIHDRLAFAVFSGRKAKCRDEVAVIVVLRHADLLPHVAFERPLVARLRADRHENVPPFVAGEAVEVHRSVWGVAVGEREQEAAIEGELLRRTTVAVDEYVVVGIHEQAVGRIELAGVDP